MALMLSTNANAKPDPLKKSDDAQLCSLYAVIASNYMHSEDLHVHWRDNAYVWLEHAATRGASRTKDSEAVNKSLELYRKLPEDKLLPLSLESYEAGNCTNLPVSNEL